MAEKEIAEDSTLWTVALEKVSRITSDEPSLDDGNLFSVEFEAQGPNMNAQIEVLLGDIADESNVVAEAMDTAQDGLEQWAAVLGRRPSAAAIEPSGE